MVPHLLLTMASDPAYEGISVTADYVVRGPTPLGTDMTYILGRLMLVFSVFGKSAFGALPWLCEECSLHLSLRNKFIWLHVLFPLDRDFEFSVSAIDKRSMNKRRLESNQRPLASEANALSN